MTDIVERLREDANGLRQAVSQASFASDTYVRVKQPDLLIAALNEAADEIERLRRDVNRLQMCWKADQDHAKWLLERRVEDAAEIERLREALADIEKLSEDGTAAKMISKQWHHHEMDER